MSYQSDPFLFSLSSELGRAQTAFANARHTGFGLDEARARRELAQSTFDTYRSAASLLSERERLYAIENRMSALELVEARRALPPDYYELAVSGTGTMSVRECLSVLRTAKLSAASDAAIVANVAKALEAAAQAIRDDNFDAGLVRALRDASAAFAEAEGDEPQTVASLVDAVQAAFKQKDASAARAAIVAVAEHFSFGLSAPPPTKTQALAVQRSRVLATGRRSTVGISNSKRTIY
jgi:hypothetical protein